MSNIYEALDKQKRDAERAAQEILAPADAWRARERPLPTPGSAARDRELEQLRRRLLLQVDATQPVALVFAGAVPGEGSSTMALLMARELAAWEQRAVLLVDADLGGFPRSLTGALSEADDQGPGFTDVLADRTLLSEAVRATEQASLHFLPRGGEGASSVDLMSADRLARFIREAKRHYSFVIFDGSPLVLATETSRLAAAADGTVLVVRAQRTRREVVQKASRALQQARARGLGVVLNDRRYPIPGFLYRRL